MSDSTSRPEPASGGGPFIVTLHPFTDSRQAALAPDPGVGVLTVKLVKIGQRWHNAFNEITIRQADDLFACAAQEGACYDLLPEGAEIIELTLEIQAAGVSEPLLVALKPPDGLSLQNQELDRIVPFLKGRGFLKTADPPG